MGCLNNRVELDALPPAPAPRSLPPEDAHSGGIAFDIPVNEDKPRRKPPRLSKPLYIIREVSNLNHELVESPLKEKQAPMREVEEYVPVPITSRKRTKTTYEAPSEEAHEGRSEAKTVNFIPDEAIADETASRKKRQRQGKHSDEKSSLSNRKSEPEETVSLRKKRKGSLDENTLGQHSIHYKRAKTLHSEKEFVFPSKSISINRGDTEALSALPVLIERPILTEVDYEAEIEAVVGKEGEESASLLELYHNLASQLQRRGEIEQAIAANAKYLKIARKAHGVDSCSYAAGLSVLSSIYYSLPNFQRAIENSMKARSIRAYASTEGDMHKARVLNEIGLIQLEQNHLKEATHYQEEVREIHAKVLGELKIDYQQFLGTLAPLPSRNQYYDKCVQSMELALRICARVFGENHLQTANHLDDLGTAYHDAGRTEDSLECFARCFSIMRAMRLTKHKDFETHAKHFQYNLELIRLSSNPSREMVGRALEILGSFFPGDEREQGLRALLKDAPNGQ